MKALGGVGGLVFYFSRIPFIPLIFSAIFSSSGFAQETRLPSSVMLKKQILGKEVSVESFAQGVSSGRGVQSALRSVFLGNPVPLAVLSVEGDSDSTLAPDSGHTDLYVRGIRIWSGDLKVGPEGLSYQGGVAPTQVIFPLLSYPVGPVLLRVDSGVEFEGKLNAALGVWGARALAQLDVAGFVEGYGSLHWIRAGLRGRLGLVEGQGGAQVLFSSGGEENHPELVGSFTLLRGEIRAFLDTRLILGRWSRILNKRVFSWPGKCFQFGEGACNAP